MSALKTIRNWLNTYPGISRLQALRVDYYAPQPGNGSIDPSGLVEVSRTEDILGNIIVQNQYNFGLYYVLEKSPGDDEGAAENADWLMEFQEWVQEQSARRLVPTFGDDPKSEQIKAQNGAVFAADEEGTAIYSVQLSINFTKIYKE